MLACKQGQRGATAGGNDAQLTLPPLVEGVVRGAVELCIGGLEWYQPSDKPTACQVC